MARKVIALCVTAFDPECETMVVDGIYNKCRERDINLLIFNPLIEKPPLSTRQKAEPSIIRGESEIFNLINYDGVDGIILLGESFINPDVIAEINQKALAKNIPVINVNDPEHPVQYNVELSDENAMEKVMRHLVEDHGLRVINFIGGFPDNLQTEERLDAYKKVLTENGIPIEEDRIDYGFFYKQSVDCVKKFLKADKKPQAIVCANDTMAFYAMDYLKKEGYSIPEDIVVTGFDGIKDCFDFEPTLTSVRRAFRTSGEAAVEMMEDIWNGGNPGTLYVESEIIKNQSCGCGVKKDENFHSYDDRYSAKNLYGEFNFLFQRMNRAFSEAVNSRELFNILYEISDFFKIKRMFVCICDGVEKPERLLKESDEKPYGITEKAVSMAQIGHKVKVGTVFDVKNYAPVDILNEEEPCTFFFTPLYFKDTFLGYVAYETEEIMHKVGDLIGTWTMQIGNNAGSFYLKKELEYVVERLDDLYARDSLTGLYNRRGMEKNKVLVERAIAEELYVTVVATDIDYLKNVNDEYGHEGGDVVIVRVSAALAASFPGDAVVVRTGGDEFMSFFIHDGNVDVKAMIKSVDNSLQDFNEHSGLPYLASCSCGFITSKISSMDDFEKMMKEADDRMYKVKQAKKAVRMK